MEEGNEGTVPSLKVNRGGKLDSSEVIGREREIRILLRTLEQQSVLVAAERRIGKTTICLEAQRRCHPNGFAIYLDIENVSTTTELVDRTMEFVLPHLGGFKKAEHQLKKVYKTIDGKAVTLPDWAGGGSFSLPSALKGSWKEILSDAIHDLVDAQTTGKGAKRFVCLFVDEFPVALENIAAKEGDRAAMEVLDLLRALRAQYGTTLRFVFTGSIGIHHLLRRLHKQGYANQPINDVHLLHINALGLDDAQILARGLLRGTGLACENPDVTAHRIAEESCGFPFYVHQIVGALQDEERVATPDSVSQIVGEQITSPLDPWKMRDYKTRLDRYFPDTRPVAIALLNILSVTKTPLQFTDVVQRFRLNPAVKDIEEETISDSLDLLEKDFYIARDPNHIYQFRRPLLARAWRHIQHLSAE